MTCENELMSAMFLFDHPAKNYYSAARNYDSLNPLSIALIRLSSGNPARARKKKIVCLSFFRLRGCLNTRLRQAQALIYPCLPALNGRRRPRICSNFFQYIGIIIPCSIFPAYAGLSIKPDNHY